LPRAAQDRSRASNRPERHPARRTPRALRASVRFRETSLRCRVCGRNRSRGTLEGRTRTCRVIATIMSESPTLQPVHTMNTVTHSQQATP
jgi:hypothetical protein